MKEGVQISTNGYKKTAGRFLFLFLASILSINLSGQRTQTMLSESWTSGSWVKAFQTNYTYDGSGNILSSVNQTWDVPSLSWKDFSRSNYTNNPDGTANVVINQTWSGTTWIDASRTTYTYTASKKIQTSITENWMGAIWMNLLKQINTYDGSGYLIKNESQTWDMISSSWKNNLQTNYTNNPNGTVNLEISQTWSGSAWENTDRTTYTYNGSLKVLTAVTDKWSSGSWKSFSMETNTYDGSGYILTELSQLWDTGPATWKNDSRSNYTNNPNGTASQVIMQTWDGISAWNNTQRLTFTYSSPTGINETVREAGFTIYPNPASNMITIKTGNTFPGNSYSITDQAGKLILKGKLTDGITSVDISKLNNGMYFLNIGERSQNTFKIIKQDLK
jgi:hypothetical protein